MDTEVKRPIERRETMIIITDDDHICCYQATFDSRRIKVYHRFIEIAKGEFRDWDVKTLGMTYEIKRDYWYQNIGNILIEWMYNMESGKPGWFKYSQADKLIVFVTDDDFYSVDLKSLRAQFELDSALWKAIMIPQKGGRFHTLNYITRLSNVIVESWVNIHPNKTKHDNP